MIWKPNVTVAAVIEYDGRFMVVEEDTDDGIRINQPAGHLEANESLIAAVRREVLEETAWDFTPGALLGVYHWRHPSRDITYLRFAFTGTLDRHHPERPLDKGIRRALWLSLDELRANASQHRSPLILRCIEDYLAGQRAPLDLLVHVGEEG
jgi:8-oxo-dGTP pyrophosphatase MutT (NUDIX family)